ncbi:NlpC/P60 family protein [Nitratireductor basaltis]|uniref:NLP/P60 protein n=1 Tax=Nitratireductor basaltis TaxID=472175 RepID=A0A084U5X7_9HYPH|nr:NlpC/P60 family protein [Nitratireductor basaltis]KFB08363.1 NLP/P60 protein [Nitratireductor basaltis]
MEKLDRRLHAFRRDLADTRLKGRVEADRFVEGWPARVAVPIVNVHSAPSTTAGMDTQLLHGEDVQVFEEADGWSWVQADADNYVGYVESAGLEMKTEHLTHVVCVPRSFAYPQAELKTPPLRCHSMGARLHVSAHEEKRGTRYAILADGSAMIANHLQPLEQDDGDYVAVAECFLHTPYLWGGCSGCGIDCSGLVQLSMQMAGRACPRDTDMQENHFLHEVEQAELRRGDLVFWKGHVAIMLDDERIIHANGHTMTVAIESLELAIERVARLYDRPTGYRRP